MSLFEAEMRAIIVMQWLYTGIFYVYIAIPVYRRTLAHQ